MFSFFKKKTPPATPAPEAIQAPPALTVDSAAPPAAVPAVAPVPVSAQAAAPAAAERKSWLDKLRAGLRKTGSGIAQVFTGTQIDDALYDDLEAALLTADTGVKATEYLLTDLKRRVKEARATDPSVVKALLTDRRLVRVSASKLVYSHIVGKVAYFLSDCCEWGECPRAQPDIIAPAAATVAAAASASAADDHSSDDEVDDSSGVFAMD